MIILAWTIVAIVTALVTVLAFLTWPVASIAVALASIVVAVVVAATSNDSDAEASCKIDESARSPQNNRLLPSLTSPYQR
jgi:membrane protein implicated in regulation of membrane protease activity